MTKEALTQALLDMTQTLYRVAWSQLPNAADREDAVQETLCRVWQKRGTLRDERLLQTWTVWILLNVCHDIQRRNARTLPMDVQPETPRTAEEDRNLAQALQALDARERVPILLYYIEGYDIRRVAAMLRVPPGTVKSRLSRGRKQLREMLREEVLEP